MRFFCSGVPNTTTGFKPKMFMCTADAPEKPAPDSAMACIITAASVMPRPEPPYSSGIAMPSQPSLASAWCSSDGKPPCLSFLSQYSSGKRAQILSIAARIASCSGLKPKSIRCALSWP